MLKGSKILPICTCVGIFLSSEVIPENGELVPALLRGQLSVTANHALLNIDTCTAALSEHLWEPSMIQKAVSIFDTVLIKEATNLISTHYTLS